MPTINDALQLARELPHATEGYTLIAHYCQQTNAYLMTHPDAVIADQSWQSIIAGFKRLQLGEPLAYVIGEVGFYQHHFKVTPDVLIPRADTEILVETVLAAPLPAGARILECGTGSGAIALSLALARSDWHVDACDISTAALAVAKENQQRLNCGSINWIHSDWFSAIKRQDYDAVISNPPYIAVDDPACELSVRQYEPAQALFADDQGLAAIALLIQQARDYLKPAGYCWLEHGYQQQPAVHDLFKGSGWQNIQSVKDLQGHWRVTGASYAK